MNQTSASESKVSIVTPAYNAARFIRATIESVVRQSHAAWELLVVDDCSSDETVEIVQQYAAVDERIRLIRQAANGGPAQARNAALQASTGRFIAFLDSDDTWHPQKLERQLSFMAGKGAKISFTAFHRISADGSRMGRSIRIPGRLTYGDLLKNTAIATSTAMVDREATGDFRMQKVYYDDYALWLELTRRGFAAEGLQDDLMEYRVTGGSVSRNKVRSARMVWRLYRDVERLSALRSAWCLSHYGWNALRKYSRF